MFRRRSEPSKALSKAAQQIAYNTVSDWGNISWISTYRGVWNTHTWNRANHSSKNKFSHYTGNSIRRSFIGEGPFGYSNKGNESSKFAVIDFDYMTKIEPYGFTTKEASDLIKTSIRYLKTILSERWGIHHTVTNFSGGKGYHLWFFFNQNVPYSLLNEIYEDVMNELADYVHVFKSHIDFIPSKNHGIKLPIQPHYTTQQRAWIVDEEFIPMFSSADLEDMILAQAEYFANIPKNEIKFTDAKLQLEVLIDKNELLAEETKEEVEHILTEELDLTKFGSYEGVAEKCEMMIECKRLLDSNRNINCYLLAAYMNEQGFSEDEIIDIISQILINSENMYKSPLSQALEDLQDITNRVLSNNYQINGNPQIELNADDFEDILLCDARIETKEVMTLILLLGRRYTRNIRMDKDSVIGFNAPYSVLQKYSSASRDTIKAAIDKLEEIGLIKVIRTGEIDDVLSTKKEHTYYKTNIYQLANELKEKTVIVDLNAIKEIRGGKKNERAIWTIAHSAFDKKSLKQLVGVKYFEKNQLAKLYR
jgi:hypothetical protein